MRTTIINELKIGDRLADTEPSKYGYYTNRIISEIVITKSGRYKIKHTFTYVYDGESDKAGETEFSDGALKGNYPVTLF